jgi:ABC-type transporter Mla subunit MlaD
MRSMPHQPAAGYGEPMADTSTPGAGLGDLFALFAGSNPLSGITKSVAQFQRGTNEFLAAVENFNATMEQVNIIAQRVNRLLDDVEPPIRALMPQITRTLKTTDTMVEQMSALPKDLNEFIAVIGDVARRLQPLGQLAESAGGLFGLRPLGAMRGAGRAAPEPPPPAPPVPPLPVQKVPAKKVPARKVPAKKTPAKKAPAKKAPAKKP